MASGNGQWNLITCTGKAPEIRIGIDFDNTIICYDDVFSHVAAEKGLIPTGIAGNKTVIKNLIVETRSEDEWTELQGYVYGERLAGASAFPGAIECMANLLARGHDVFIISHKTRHPYKGPKYDLRGAARDWLQQNGIFDPESVGLNEGCVFFEGTKSDKIARIKDLGCTCFIDDLPELLIAIDFLDARDRLLFDPNRSHPTNHAFRAFSSWSEIASSFNLFFAD